MCNENKIEPALNKLLLKIIKTKGIILFCLNDVLSLGIAHTLLGSHEAISKGFVILGLMLF